MARILGCLVAVVLGKLQCEEPALVPLQLASDSPQVEGLAWLIHSIPEADLVSSYAEKWPFHVRRPASFHTKLGSLEVVDQLLETQRLAQTDALLLHPSKKFSQANCEWVKQGMRDLQGEYSDVYSAYLDGATVVCHLVAAYWPPLASLMQRLEQSCGYPFMANLYLSPRGTQGFTAHSDNKDGYIVQVAGSKRWEVREGTFPLPLRRHRVGRQWELSAGTASTRLVFNRSLEEGDVLLVPRGFIHHAESHLGSASMHFTVSAVENLEWAGLLLAFLELFPKASVPEAAADFFFNALASAVTTESDNPANVYLRRSLSFHYQLESSRSRLLEQFEQVVSQLRETIRRELEEVPQEMLASFEASFELLFNSPERDSVLGAALQANMVKLDYVSRLASAGLSRQVGPASSVECVRWCSDLRPTLELGDTLLLSWPVGSSSKKLSLRRTPALETMVGELLGRPSVCVADLPGNDHFEKVCLVNMLVRPHAPPLSC
jgi:hypothetical protein